MLSEVLSKESCAKCRFCCSFRRCSLWETPLFSDEAIKKLEKDNEYGVKGIFKDRQPFLENGYKTDDPEEEVPCTFLDPDKGCILKPEDKPFDCSIWPLRIMEKNDQLVIAFTPTCSALGKEPGDKLTELVQEKGLGLKIYEYAKSHRYMIKKYKEGFPVIMSMSKY